MQVKCQIDNTRSVKGGFKIVLHLDKEAKLEFLKHQANFEEKPLIVDFQIDAKEQQARLNTISPDQRKKIYALFNDIAASTGDNAESVKHNMKYLYRKAYDLEDFSLSNCDAAIAGDFITYMVAWCFVNGTELKEHPREILDDINVYLYLCLKYKKCAVCGKDADEHHVNAIGMGRDRNNYDDSGHKKIALCRGHHTEAHTIGWETFSSKYHVTGVLFNE